MKNDININLTQDDIDFILNADPNDLDNMCIGLDYDEPTVFESNPMDVVKDRIGNVTEAAHLYLNTFDSVVLKFLK